MSGIGSIAAASVDVIVAADVWVAVVDEHGCAVFGCIVIGSLGTRCIDVGSIDIGIGGIDVDTVGDRGGCAGGDPFQAECAW